MTKIRATLCDTVVVGEGERSEDRNGFWLIKVDTGLAEVACYDFDGWQFEVLTSLPDKVGAVVRNSRENVLYVRISDDYASDNGAYPWLTLGCIDGQVWGDDTVADGGFTVVFDGVDE
jgi:hypothetical protein